MQTSTIVTVLSAIVSLASVVSAPALDGLWPGHGTYLMGVITVTALVAGVVINALTKQTQGAPQTGLQVGPLAKDLDIVNTAGDTVATNVSSTSNIFARKE